MTIEFSFGILLYGSLLSNFLLFRRADGNPCTEKLGKDLKKHILSELKLVITNIPLALSLFSQLSPVLLILYGFTNIFATSFFVRFIPAGIIQAV